MVVVVVDVVLVVVVVDAVLVVVAVVVVVTIITRLNAFARSCFLTHPRSPGGDTVPEKRCWQTADRKNSQCFNRIVHRHLWVKVHETFHTCRAPRGLFTVKV